MKSICEMKSAWESWQNNRQYEEKVLSDAGFKLLQKGSTVHVRQLALKLSWTNIRIQARLQEMAALGRCTLDSSGDLTGVMGLSVVPTGHQLQMLDKTFYTWCALDAVAIPAALEVHAIVNSSTADKKEDITLHYTQGKWRTNRFWVHLVHPSYSAKLCEGT